MTTRKTTALAPGRLVRRGFLALALAAAAGGTLAAPAFADEWRHQASHSYREHDRHIHRDRDDRYFAPGRGYAYGYAAPGYAAPAYGYAVPYLNFGVTIR